MISTSDFEKGIIIKIGDQPLQIVSYKHVNPGKGSAFVRTTFRNFKTGKMVEKTFRSGEKFELMEVEYREATYLYHDRKSAVFLTKDNQRINLFLESVSEKIPYLKPNLEIKLVHLEGELVSVQLPAKVNLKVVSSPMDIKGDSATSGTKIVTLETGLKVAAPLFIKEGDILRINTETGQYTERTKEE